MVSKDLKKNLDLWRQQNQKIVLVTGVFDLLHIEHIRFLSKAKAAGTKLIVGLEADFRIKQIKGHERPIHSEAVRQEQLLALKPVDHAFILPESFSTQEAWENLIESIKPAVYAVSSHTSFLENKAAICKKYGIHFAIVHEFNANYSSSVLIQKLLSTQ